ncbi:hypothetical protein A1O3_01851 [Capronia epimyces CBS 606.96]|uniref:Uncharacterized protein n=1 Tax=Capronia epimyces CBS 606.96 TaxID=1182542 RepID=W9Y7G2_9EURO|nr:uncharacterized protein A1O3_01851 [Capronia epimyces CBS 606.96]EXJ88787.1 hypothetical protein A1O3_01851 [Capronia epimyces CBS 606.96]
MDSMRSLNTGLPSTRPAPPEELLQAFRNAALSVTNLYKSAVTDQNVSRQAGYQEALDDLLGFLDHENLGLQDGEGWRVRQWATERYDGSAHQHHTDSDDDKSEMGTRPRSVSPPREQPQEAVPTPAESVKVESATQTEDAASPTARDETTSPSIFQFTGRESDHMQTDEEGAGSAQVDGSSSSSTNPPIRLEVLNSRGHRPSHRHGSQRHGPRQSNREFTFNAGTKRKLQFPDFFDISNIGPKDGFGTSTKRGRLS